MARLFAASSFSAPVIEQPLERLGEVATVDGWFWLDGGVDDVEALLPTIVELADADLEDVIAATELPKFEIRSDYVFAITHSPAASSGRFTTSEVDIVTGERFVITMHRDPAPATDALIDGLGQAGLTGPQDLLGRLVKTIAGRYLPLVTALDEQIDTLEDLAISGDPSGLEQLQALRRDTIRLRRVLAPMREAFRQLAAADHSVLDKRTRRHLHAAADDFSIALEGVDTARLLLSAVLDTYRASVAERMNEVMKVLTVFSAIVLPLGLLAGIYGMNFATMPELQIPWAYYALLGVMATVGVGLWVYFARRGFIGGPRIPRVDRAVGRGLAAFVHLTLAPTRAILGSPSSPDEAPH